MKDEQVSKIGGWRLALLAIGCGLAFSAPQPAQAQASVSSQAAAESLFQEGVQLTEAGSFEPACEKFAASQELDPTIGTQLRLADCYEQIGRVVSAWSLFRLVEGQARAKQQTDRAELASRRAEQLTDQLSYITVQVGAADTEGLVVKLGNEKMPQATWGTRVPLDPGTSELTASAPGREPWSTTVVLEPRGEVGVQVPELIRKKALPHKQAVSPAAQVKQQPAENGSNVAAWVFGGAGALALAGSGALGYYAYSLNDDSKKECRQPNVCSQRGVSLRNDAGKLADIATVGIGVGSALIVTGAILLLTGEAPSNDDPTIDASEPAQPDVALAASSLKGGGLINLVGQW